MMKKLLSAKTLVLTLLVLSGLNIAYAQDTTKAKTAKPAFTPGAKPPIPGAKPFGAKPGVAKYPYHAAGTYQAPAPKPQVPSATTAPGAQPGTPVYTETPVSTDKTLSGQYQYVLSKTYHYQQTMIAALWKNVNDTLNAEKKALKGVQPKLAAQGRTIDSLRNDVKLLTEAQTHQDSIDFMGVEMSKTAYNMTMWGLVVVLAVGLILVILRTGGAGREAKYRTQLYDELNEEFTAFKAKSKDKELKMARELQTERNKVDELMGR